MQKRKESTTGKSWAQRKHEKRLILLTARSKTVAAGKPGKRKDKKLLKLAADIEYRIQAIEDIEEKIKEKKARKVARTLRKRAKKMRGDKTPYRLIVIRDGIITERNYDAVGFAKIHIPETNTKGWVIRAVQFGLVEGKILDVDGHIILNSANTISVSEDDRVALGTMKLLDAMTASFLSYSAIIVLAGVLFGYPMALAGMWVLKQLLYKVIS